MDASGADYDFSGFCFPAILINRSFARSVFFHDAIFRGKAVFHNARFQAQANFASCEFNSGAMFLNSNFDHYAAFSNATFRGEANFSQSSFMSNAHFDCEFWGEATFFSAEFAGQARFVSDFRSEVSFELTQFRNVSDFSNCTFRERAKFLNTQFANCQFTNIDRESASRVLFDNVDLQRMSFLNTDIEEVTFRGVTWFKAGKRHALWDEFRPAPISPPREYARIAENYRQLVLNHENKRDFDLAEDFHIGEMEMRRVMTAATIHSASWRAARRRINAYSVYALLSRYGTSYVRAFEILLVMTVLFALSFMILGFQVTPPPGSGNRYVIQYRLCVGDLSCAPASQLIEDFVRAIRFTLSSVTLQRDRPYTPAGLWSQLVFVGATVGITVQTTLLLLAIRRRFKR